MGRLKRGVFFRGNYGFFKMNGASSMYWGISFVDIFYGVLIILLSLFYFIEYFNFIDFFILPSILLFYRLPVLLILLTIFTVFLTSFVEDIYFFCGVFLGEGVGVMFFSLRTECRLFIRDNLI